MRQEVANNKGKVVGREVGCAAQGADDGSLLFSGSPRQLIRTGGAVEAIGDTALAHGFRTDAVAPDSAAEFSGAGDLGAGCSGGAGIGMDVQHGSPLS